MEFRKQLISRFPSIFGSKGTKGVASEYGWFAILNTLAGGNILNVEKVAALELNLCLMKLSLDTDVAVEKNLESKKQQVQNKARR
mgnify:CR=1 FL=1